MRTPLPHHCMAVLLACALPACVITSNDDPDGDATTDTDGTSDTDGASDTDATSDTAGTTDTDSGPTTETGADECPPPAPEGDEPPMLLDCNAFGDDLQLIDDPDRAVDYVVDCRANVNGALSIEPGVVIEFEPEAGLVIQTSIDAVGDPCDPIVMRGTSAGPGSWNGVIVFSDDISNTMEFVEIHDAGGGEFNSNGDLGSLLVYAGGALTLRDSLLAGGAAYGFNAHYGGNRLVWERNRIEGHEAPAAHMPSTEAGALDEASTFEGNPGGDYIEVIGEQMSTEVTWRALSVPYQILRDTIVESRESFTVEAGARLDFESMAGLSANGGWISLEGTADAPVVLDGVLQDPGSWRGIIFDNESDLNRLDHVEIRNAGGGAFNSNGDLGAIIVWAGTALTLADSTIADSAARGLNATYGETRITFEGANTFTGNGEAPIWMGAYGVSSVTPETVVTDNLGGDFVFAWASDLNGAHTWEPLSVPYRIAPQNGSVVHVRTDASLDITAGAHLVFEEETGISSGGGVFDVSGTADNPVVMEGTQAQAGWWKGMIVEGDDDANRAYSFTGLEMSHAGGSAFNSNGDIGGLIVWAGTDVTVADSTIADHAGPCSINAPYTDDSLSLSGNSFSGQVCDGP